MIKRITAALLAALLALMWVAPAYALIDQPDSMSVVSARGFVDLAEDGDAAVVFHWRITYYSDNGSYPTVPASDSIIFQLYDDDGVTLLNTAAPYVYAPFETNGYRDGVSVFYFSESDNFTPALAYQIKIQQSITYFAVPTSSTYTMTASDWTDDTESDMKDYVLSLCDRLSAIYTDVPLSASTDIGNVFSTYGEQYFRGAIPGVQTMCPALFYVQDYSPAEMEVDEYTTDLQDQYSIRMQGSEILRGAGRLGAHFGLGGYFILGIVILVACIACAVVTMKRGWGLEPGGIGASIIAIAGAWALGNAVFTIVMIGSLVAVMAIMFTFVGRRA